MDDFLQVQDNTGAILSKIDATGSLSAPTVSATTVSATTLVVGGITQQAVQAVKTTHNVTAGDVSAGAIKVVVALPTAYADTNYTAVSTVFVNEARTSQDYVVYQSFSAATTSFSCVIGANTTTALTSDVLTIDTIVLHN